MNTRTYTFIGITFGIIILLTAAIGVFAVQNLLSISNQTTRLYERHYVVSNAAQNINTQLVSMHRYMKDVVLAKNIKDMNLAMKLIREHEGKVFQNFGVIKERYLGDKSKLDKLYKDFIAWREIRADVNALIRDGYFDSAAKITKNKGADHVKKLLASSNEFVEFASSKAAELHKEANRNTDESIQVLSILIIVVIIISILITINTLLKLIKSDKIISERNHLVDQNIMMAQLKLSGEIIDITNALCRYLGVFRSDMLEKQSNFFLSEDQIRDKDDYIWHQIKSGKQWAGEVRFRDRDNKINWYTLSIIPEFNDSHQLHKYSCLIHDITSKKDSETDSLTTLGNRRLFEEVLDNELKLAKRRNDYITLAIMDIDFFKRYNDHYGHPAGDDVLKKVGKAILSSMRRPDDYAFRIGGEEFAVLFTETDKEHSLNYCETIRRSIESLEIAHVGNDVSDNVSISIGATSLMGNEISTTDAFYKEADDALYKAKETRNITVMSD